MTHSRLSDLYLANKIKLNYLQEYLSWPPWSSLWVLILLNIKSHESQKTHLTVKILTFLPKYSSRKLAEWNADFFENNWTLWQWPMAPTFYAYIFCKNIYFDFSKKKKKKKKNKRSRRTCIAPLACTHMIFKQDIAGDTNPLPQIYL